jgi:hypothetical protein
MRCGILTAILCRTVDLLNFLHATDSGSIQVDFYEFASCPCDSHGREFPLHILRGTNQKRSACNANFKKKRLRPYLMGQGTETSASCAKLLN